MEQVDLPRFSVRCLEHSDWIELDDVPEDAVLGQPREEAAVVGAEGLPGDTRSRWRQP